MLFKAPYDRTMLVMTQKPTRAMKHSPPRCVLIPTAAPLAALAALNLLLLIGLSAPAARHGDSTTTALTRGLSLAHRRCPFPLVYNKPPKTASSFIRTVITNWTIDTGRADYRCSTGPLVTSVVLQECVPMSAVTNPCAVVNCHIFLSPHARSLLHARLPGLKYLTSTRYPAHRIVSYYLQVNELNVNAGGNELHDGLRVYLRWYNPWRLYNFHTGGARVGKCPLSEPEIRHVFDLAMRFDLVIDANLRNESNVILKAAGLFQLPEVADSKDRNKERGAWRMPLPDDIKELLHARSCVEVELHKALQLRMASLYERATGVSCIRHGSRTQFSSCIEDREREVLKDHWAF